MIDRALTQRLANAVARGSAATRSESPAPAALPGDLVAICTDAQLRVVDLHRGCGPATALPIPEAVQRPAWIEANVNSMGALLDPVGERLRPAACCAGRRARPRACSSRLRPEP